MPGPIERSGADDADLLQQARNASIDTAVQQLRLIHELRHRRSVVAECSSAPKLKPTTTGIEEFLFDLARLSVSNYDQWLKLTSKHFPQIVDVLRQLSGRPAPDVPLPAPVSMTVAGAYGERVTSRLFRIENPFDVDVSLSFSSPEFNAVVDDGGAPPTSAQGFLANVTLEQTGKDGTPTGTTLAPGRDLRLKPGESTYLRVVLPLSLPFEAGQRYFGNGRLLSAGRAVGLLCVEVSVT